MVLGQSERVDLEVYTHNLLAEIEKDRDSSSEIGFPITVPLSKRDWNRAPNGAEYRKYSRVFYCSYILFSKSLTADGIWESLRDEFLADMRKTLLERRGKIWWRHFPAVALTHDKHDGAEYEISCAFAIGDLIAEDRGSSAAPAGSVEGEGQTV